MATLALAALAALAGGCVERTLMIDSQPQGARVTINGHPAGVTPTGPIRFDHYGVYEILLERDGSVPLEISLKLRAPWHGRFPLDFFAEVLWPFRIRDERKHTFKLAPLGPLDRKKLLDNANRARVKSIRQ